MDGGRAWQAIEMEGLHRLQPAAERALGVRAGFGWIGRNTSLISARIGSFFWLAEILTDLPWKPARLFRQTAAEPAALRGRLSHRLPAS